MFETTKEDYLIDVVIYKKIVENKWTYKFLLELNKNLDEVQGRILGTQPLPNIQEITSKVHLEESKKKVILGSESNQLVT